MGKKIFVILVALILGSAYLAEAQNSGKVRRIAFLSSRSQPDGRVEVFRQALRELGYVEGKNLAFHYRGHEDRSQLGAAVAQLPRERFDVIVTQGGATRAAQEIKTVPIVFGYSGDAVEAGLVKSLARPEGNLTGITMLAFELVGKRLEVLKESVPKISRVSVLSSPAHPGEQRELSESQKTARDLNLTLLPHRVDNKTDVTSALDATITEKADALLAFPDPITNAHREQIANFVMKHRLPSVFGWSNYVEAGGLMSYGPDHNALWRRLAIYVDKVLKGTKPADLPIEQPTKFELVINLKTAKQIGLTIPPDVLARATRVIR